MAFVVHRWGRQNGRDGKHIESFFFVSQDVPLPVRQALENSQYADVSAYVPADVIRAASASIVPVRWVFRMIAPDDRTDVACKKVLYELLGRRKMTQEDGMAAWRKTGPVLFRFEGDDWPANPFQATNAAVERMTRQRAARDNEWIGADPLHVALAADLEPSIRDAYVWSIASVKIPSQEHAWMTAFYREATTGVPLYDENDVKFIECTWTGVVGQKEISLERAFAKLHTSSRAPLLQWLDDRHHILYKLHKKHKLPAVYLETLTKYERIPLTGPSYIAASIIDFDALKQSPSSINSRLAIKSTGSTELRLRPNISGIKAFKSYEKERILWAREWLGSVVKTREWALTNATVRVVYLVSSFSLPTIIESMSRYTSFVNIKRMSAGGAQGKYLLQWLRASNYKANVDISNVINARLRLGVDMDTILNDLVDINGLSLGDARALLDGVISTLENPENVNVREQRHVAVAVGLTMMLAPHPKGVEITMRDVASYDDVQMALFWLHGMLKVVVAGLKNNAISQMSPPLAIPNASPKQEQAVAKPTSSLEADPFALSSSASSFTSSSSSSRLSGGSDNFIVDLQKADPQLFANNYSKRCQSASNSQPVVMTQAEFAALDAKYKRTLSSHIVYGSSSDARQHHVYFCPTVWCSESRTPMSYEQYVENGNKCPDGKAGVKLWEEDNKKRKLANVGFYGKSIEGAEPCLPCCYSRALNEVNKGKCMKKVVGTKEEIKPTAAAAVTAAAAATVAHDASKASTSMQQAPPTNANAKDYLLTHSAPLPKDRWGTLPRSLHMVLHPSSLLHTQCTQQLTSKPCLLRRGILHNSDSFMQALGYLFTGKTGAKSDVLKLLRVAITPDVFVTLENGLVLAAFAIEDTGIVPTDSACAKWLTWMATPECKQYKRLFGLRRVVQAAKAKQYDEQHGHAISRELAIYKAFMRFHAYLASNELKDASLLVDAVRHMSVQLILWEKDAADPTLVRMRCPSAVPYSALPDASEPAIGMLLQEKGVFEPIELGTKSDLGGATLHNPTTALKKMMNECDSNIIPGVPETRSWVETVRSIEASVRLTLEKSEEYIWQKVVVSPDYAIIGLINAHGFVSCGRIPISALIDLFEVLPHIQVIYQEDVVLRHISHGLLDTQDASIFHALLTTFGIGIESTQTVMIDAPPIIPTRVHDNLKQFEDGAIQSAAAWRSTKWLVGRELMKAYATRVAPFNRAERDAFVLANSNAFPAAAKYIDEALYEIAGFLPSTSSSEARTQRLLREWMTSTDNDSWPFLSTTIISRGTKEWVFSQLAIENGLPSHLIKPVEGARPRVHVRKSDPEFQLTWPNKVVRTSQPKTNSTEHTKLPWKWEAARKYSWRDWVIVLPSNGTESSYICKYLEWAAGERGIPFKWSMVTFAMQVYIANIIAVSETSIDAFVKQPGVIEIIKSIAKLPKATSASKVISFIMGKSLPERRELFGHAQLGTLVTDIDIELAARWSGITILIVANVDYAKSDKIGSPVLCADFKPTVDKEEDLEICADGPNVTTNARGSTKDLITNAVLLYNDELSTTREALWKRPFVMLYKDVPKGSGPARYAPVGQGLWPSLRHCPKDLQHVTCCLWKHKNN